MIKHGASVFVPGFTPPVAPPRPVFFPLKPVFVLVDMIQQIDEEGCGAVFGPFVEDTGATFYVPFTDALKGEYQRRMDAPS